MFKKQQIGQDIASISTWNKKTLKTIEGSSAKARKALKESSKPKAKQPTIRCEELPSSPTTAVTKIKTWMRKSKRTSMVQGIKGRQRIKVHWNQTTLKTLTSKNKSYAKNYSKASNFIAIWGEEHMLWCVVQWTGITSVKLQ